MWALPYENIHCMDTSLFHCDFYNYVWTFCQEKLWRDSNSPVKFVIYVKTYHVNAISMRRWNICTGTCLNTYCNSLKKISAFFMDKFEVRRIILLYLDRRRTQAVPVATWALDDDHTFTSTVRWLTDLSGSWSSARKIQLTASFLSLFFVPA